MVAVILIIVGVVVVLYFYRQNKTAEKEKVEVNVQTSRKGENWVFERELGHKGIPPIIETYRKHLIGMNKTQIEESLNVFLGIQDEIEKSQALMQLSEPLMELADLGFIGRSRVDMILINSLQYLLECYPVIGAEGQIRNVQDVYNFCINKDDEAIEFEKVWDELAARNELLDIIARDGKIYQKDLKALKCYNQVSLKENFMLRMLSYGILERKKEGKFVVYVGAEDK
ncbi:hypothetical protein [uncultured Draconibacterium sp.]|uniref:hypothetical protein n=1 Tax=uncultured Draconibacterium sp. TaxID=1573823 RepID=UPI0029C7FD96|nr:hypothetical protein [uncultured Draconibacterium sp.]